MEKKCYKMQRGILRLFAHAHNDGTVQEKQISYYNLNENEDTPSTNGRGLEFQHDKGVLEIQGEGADKPLSELVPESLCENRDEPTLTREGDRVSGGGIELEKVRSSEGKRVSWLWEQLCHSEPYLCQASAETSKVSGEESPCVSPCHLEKSIEQSESRFLTCSGVQNQTPTLTLPPGEGITARRNKGLLNFIPTLILPLGEGRTTQRYEGLLNQPLTLALSVLDYLPLDRLNAALADGRYTPAKIRPKGRGYFGNASLEKRQGKWVHLKHLKFLLTYLPTYLLTSVKNLGTSYPSALLPSKRAAFTLAEVLITLGIIGVVAAMTLPALVQKYEEKQAVTSLKKFYSSISQAYLYAKNEYGNPDIWYTDNSSQQDWSDTMLDNFAQFMKTTKICHSDKGCFPDVTYKKIDGTNATNWDNYSGISRLITSDGMSVFFFSYGSSALNDRGDSGALTETYGAISVDINGFKKPNVFGRDMFTFVIARDGIVPFGIPAATHTNTDTEEVEKSFPKSCNTENCFGWCEGCCAWVIYNENMDYLHCSDLSWDGKKKCK